MAIRKLYEINAEAYGRKASLGGGFCGVAKIAPVTPYGLPDRSKPARELRTEIHGSQQDAFAALFALIEAEAQAVSGTMTVGHFRSNRFRKIYWIFAA